MPRSPETQRIGHIRITDPCLPYITNTSVTDGRPHYVAGSHDVLTSINGVAQSRWGTFRGPIDLGLVTGDIRRYFYWPTNTGKLLMFASVINGGQSSIYKVDINAETTWTLLWTDSASGEPFDYVVSNGVVYMANGHNVGLKYDGTVLSTWGIEGPISNTFDGVTFNSITDAGAGNVPNYIGHSYVFAYGTAATGYVSDISEVTSITPTMGSAHQWTLQGPGSIANQIDEVHIYRTEDGGANYYELSNSPIADPGVYPNPGTWTVVDNDADEDLQFARPAPLRYVNSAAPRFFQPTIFAGRIWGFKEDRVYFSTLEENNTSVPTECFGTVLTNSRSVGRDITGIGVAGDFLLVFTIHGIFKVGGDTLVTFFWSTLSKNLGLRNRQNMGDYQGNLVWLDSSSTLRMTDGVSIGNPDLTLPIRPDIQNIQHDRAQVHVHDDALHSWICLMDGYNETLYLFDLDRKQWEVPWNIAGITAIHSNMLLPTGVYLQVARSGATMIFADLPYDHPLTGTDPVYFSSELRMNLLQVNTDNPTGVNGLEYVALETNEQQVSDVQFYLDEDPAHAQYRSLYRNRTDPAHRTQGQYLLDTRFWNSTTLGPGQRITVKILWSENEHYAAAWKLYSIDIANARVN